MPPTMNKLKGHNSLGVSIIPSARPSICPNISYMYSSSKNNSCVFFLKILITSLYGVMPLLKGHNVICTKDFQSKKKAKIQNRYNHVPRLTQDTNG